MYLLDSSVWIDAINGKPKLIEFLSQLPPNDLEVNYLIYTEVLQGATTQKKFDIYCTYLSAQPFYYLKNDKNSYQQAALIYYKCRKKGITIRSSIDCLIAQCAIENDLILLHNDQYFERVASVIPALKTQKA